MKFPPPSPAASRHWLLTWVDAATSVKGHPDDGAPVGAVPAAEPDGRVAADLPDAEEQQQTDDGDDDHHLCLRVQALLEVELGLSGLVLVRVLGRFRMTDYRRFNSL